MENQTQLQSDIDDFLSKHLPDNPHYARRYKVVHDGLWGTLKLEPWEIAFIDTPLLQRLRRIHQTGFTLYTYPSSTHTRFEHTLGVINNIKKLHTALTENDPNEQRLDRDDLKQLRIAALLHDVGHGLFSHTSEEIYGQYPVIGDLKKSVGGGSPHELLSYSIVTNKRFIKFAENIADHYRINIPCADIASYIVGIDKAGEYPFKRELINGPFDGDKLDYLFRDSHFSGLPLSVDIDRLFYTVRIANIDGKNRLAVTQSGAASLEQIYFSKMGLFSSVYQHHKVRACDCMFAGIFEYLRDNEIAINIGDKELNFKSPVDFLWLSDYDLSFYGFMCKGRDKLLHDLLHDIYYRRFLKRALIISVKTIEKTEEDRLDELFRFAKKSPASLDVRRTLAREIWEHAGKPCSLHQIWIDLPESPSFTAADKTYVLTSDGQGSNAVPLNDMFPLTKWSEQYLMHKWRGHVFCPPEHIKKISRSAKEVMEDKFKVKFKKEAFEWCKLDAPSSESI